MDCRKCPVEPLCVLGQCKRKVIIDGAVDFVQKWSDEHHMPKPRTYSDDFFEKHPNAPYKIVDGLKIPKICRTGCYAVKCSYPGNGLFNPPDCNKCWLEPYPEKENDT